MALSEDLISQFVKATKDTEKTSKESTVYGTIVEYKGRQYVRLDGSDQLTPISSTTNVVPDERVTVMIKDHTATVTGNLTSPAARYADLEITEESIKSVMGATYATKDELTGFVTETEVESVIEQTAEEIKTEMSGTFVTKGEMGDVVTTEQMNSAITQSAGEIKSEVSSTYATKDDVNNISIGGTNLVPGTSNEWTPVNCTNAAGTLVANLDISSLGLAAGDEITLSFQFKTNTGKKFCPRITFASSTGSNKTVRGTEYLQNGEGLLWFTTSIPDGWDYLMAILADCNATASAQIGATTEYFKCLKLEKGNKATDWSPAPEDMATVTAMNSAIEQSANSIKSEVSATYATKASLGDYVTETDMNSAIEQSADSITSTVSSTYATKTSVDTVASKAALAQSMADTAQGAASAAIDAAEAAQSSANTVQANLSNNYSTTAQMNSAIEQKANSITSTVASTYTTKADFNALQVGGRNLLTGSSNEWRAVSTTANAGTVATGTYESFGLTAGENIVFGVRVKTSSGKKLRARIQYRKTDGTRTSDTGVDVVQNGEGFVWVAGTVRSGYNYIDLWLDANLTGTTLTGTTTEYVKCAKLERGTKPTDWSLAPEDMAGAILRKTTVNLTASTFDVNTYYPVYASTKIPNGGYHRFQVNVQLDSGSKPSWSTHGNGFTCNVSARMKAFGWGAVPQACAGWIDDESYHWCDKRPAYVSQMDQASIGFFYLRGGGKYHLYVDFDTEWVIVTDSYTTSSQTISPTTSPSHWNLLYNNYSDHLQIATNKSSITQLSDSITSTVSRTTNLETQMSEVKQTASGLTVSLNKMQGDSTNYSQLNVNTASVWGFTADTSNASGYTYTVTAVTRDRWLSDYYECYGGETFRIDYEISTSAMGYASSSATASTYLDTAVGIYQWNAIGTASYISYAKRITASSAAPFNTVSTTVTLNANARKFRVFLQTEGAKNFSGSIKIRNLRVSKVNAIQDIANTAKTNAATAQSTANTARTEAANAAKTATNFLSFDSTNGLLVGNKTSGSWSGYRSQVKSDSFNILDQNGNEVAKYGADQIDLGINSTNSKISMCGGKGLIQYKTSEHYATDGIAIVGENVAINTTETVELVKTGIDHNVRMWTDFLSAGMSYDYTPSTGSASFATLQVEIIPELLTAEIYGEADGIYLGTTKYDLDLYAKGKVNINGRPYGVNKVLWSGNLHMNASQTAMLSGAVSDQPHGIVVIFTYYDNTAGKVYDTEFSAHFVPKELVRLHPGAGQNFFYTTPGVNFQYTSCKRLFIFDGYIAGYANNTLSTANGIGVNNQNRVLRYVIGV